MEKVTRGRAKHAVATLTSGKRLRIPDLVQESLGVRESDQVIFYLTSEAAVMVVPVKRAVRPLSETAAKGAAAPETDEGRLAGTLTNGCRLRLPEKVLKHLGVGEGDQVVFYVMDDGTATMVPSERALKSLVEVTGRRR